MEGKMKKFIAAALAIITALSFVSCAQKQQNPAAPGKAYGAQAGTIDFSFYDTTVGLCTKYLQVTWTAGYYPGSTVVVTVLDSTGKNVRTVSAPAAQNYCAWSAADSAGVPLANGTYRVVVTGKASTGTTYSRTFSMSVSIKPEDVCFWVVKSPVSLSKGEKVTLQWKGGGKGMVTFKVYTKAMRLIGIYTADFTAKTFSVPVTGLTAGFYYISCSGTNILNATFGKTVAFSAI